jgi:hypothetical protein
MKNKISGLLVCAAVLSLAASCAVEEPAPGDEGYVLIRSALGLSTHDVAGILYEITCDDGTVITQYVELEDGPMPTWLDPAAGPGHPFADLFSVLPPGECTVTATPMQDADTPSEDCAPVSETFTVLPGETVELVLMSQCVGEPAGAVDIVVGLNDPPEITALDMDLGKFICVDEPLQLTVTATDPNGDAISFTWQVTDWPENPAPGTWSLTPATGPSVSFQAGTVGPYELIVEVTDSYGASTWLTFPVHVVPCEDVCCKLAQGYQVVPPGDCPDGSQVPMDLCDSCQCPDGFDPTPDGLGCSAVSTMDATFSGVLLDVCPGNQIPQYSVFGAIYPGGAVVSDPYWGQSGQTSADGRLNSVGIWACDPVTGGSGTEPFGEWIGFTACLDIAVAGDYLVAGGGDNQFRLFLNNDPTPVLIKTGSSVLNFRRWWVRSLSLPAGLNIITLEGRNNGNVAAFGAEISGPFPAGSLTTDADMIAADYAGNIVFSTGDMIGSQFTTGTNSGYQCPAGYVLSFCEGKPECVLIETAECL